ncbi:MAG: type IX secretion system membrane protein PorP/SprF [Draconibacterium sp.]
MAVLKFIKAMKTMKIKYIVIISLFVTFGHSAFGQQDPLYSQYMFNIQAVNPAYAGTWESLGFTLLSRNQWVGVEKAPKTNTLTVQAPTKGERVGLGVSIINDKIGFVNRLALFGDYSYKIQVNENNTWLRMGLKAGFSNYLNNLEAYSLMDENDPAYQGVIEQRFMPNFGVGLFLHNPKYYLGASVPKLIQHNVENSVNKNWTVNSDLRHWFFMGGYVFELSDALKFKPSFMTRMVKGAPFQADFNANFLLKDRFWFGGSYRTGNGFGVNLQWIIDQKLRLGYAIDYSNKGIYRNSLGIHELMISYELNFLKTVFRSPRYY